MGLSLEQLSAGVVGKIKSVELPKFEVTVHLQPLSVKQVMKMSDDLEALPTNDEAAHGQASMVLMMRSVLCDENGKSLTQEQAKGLANNSSPAFVLDLQKVITEHINPSLEETRGNS